MAEITEKSFPFDADEINGKYDREYLAEDFARYFQAFISSGVFVAESTNLQVMENGDMNVILKPGKMIIDGYRYDNLDDIVIPIEPADGVLNRIDRISATWSKEDRDIHYTLQKGEPSYEAVPPECRRNNDTKDYVLADVYVAAGAISIYQKDIVDQRLNSAVCGVANPFNKIDTTSIFNQFTSWLEITREKGEEDIAEFLNISEEEIRQWFEQMKGQLSEDAAVRLQNQITEIRKPDFDDSGEVEGITSFTDFMDSFVKGMSIYLFLANLKAGLKYVLHAGQLVNNGLTETPGKFPLDAAYGKTLTDQITGLYNNLGGFEPVIDETGKITGYKTTVGGADTVFPFSNEEEYRENLYSALSKSGLVTSNMTFDQMCAVLSQTYGINTNLVNLNYSGKSSNYGNQLSVSKSGNIVYLTGYGGGDSNIVMNYNWSSSYFYRKGYNHLEIQVSVPSGIWHSSGLNDGACTFFIESNSGKKITLISNIAGGSYNGTVDLSSVFTNISEPLRLSGNFTIRGTVNQSKQTIIYKAILKP